MTRYRLTTRRKEQLIYIAFVAAVISIIIPAAIGTYTLFDTSPPTDEMVIKVYKLSYEDGVLIRSGDIGENVSWNIYENGEKVLKRYAKDEIELKLSDLEDTLQKGHTYTAYLTSYYIEYLEDFGVSNSVNFTY